MNRVEIDLSALTHEQRLYVMHVLEIAEKNLIDVLLSEDSSVPLVGGSGTTPVSGYFDESSLAVACGKPTSEWFHVFVHETCHMEQYLEHDPIWTEVFVAPDVEAISLVSLWIDNFIELNEKQKERYLQLCFDIERNCEERVLKAIDKWQLPINKTSYAQKSNAYIWFYYIIGLQRKWYETGKEPYTLEEVWTKMPTTLTTSFVPPDYIVEAFLSVYK